MSATNTTNGAEALLTSDEQAWLDACPHGESRTLTHRVGDLAKDFTVDRRIQDLAHSTPFELKTIADAMDGLNEEQRRAATDHLRTVLVAKLVAKPPTIASYLSPT